MSTTTEQPHETELALSCIGAMIDALEADVEYSPRARGYIRGARQALATLARLHTPRALPLDAP